MRNKLFVLSVLCIATALPIMPAQARTQSTIFSCTAKNGKFINVEKADSSYVLSYEKLKVSNAINEIMQRNNSRIASLSGYVLYSLEFNDSKDSYYVQYQESMGDEKPLFAGIFKVSENNEPKQLAACNIKKPIKHHFDVKRMQQSGVGY